MSMSFTWDDAVIERDVLEAMDRAGRATLADAAAQAQQPGYVPVDKGALRADITFGVDQTAPKWIGWFGAPTIAYAFRQETDTTYKHPNGGPFFLRRSADRIFPTLSARVAEEMNRR